MRHWPAGRADESRRSINRRGSYSPGEGARASACIGRTRVVGGGDMCVCVCKGEKENGAVGATGLQMDCRCQRMSEREREREREREVKDYAFLEGSGEWGGLGG